MPVLICSMLLGILAGTVGSVFVLAAGHGIGHAVLTYSGLGMATVLCGAVVSFLSEVAKDRDTDGASTHSSPALYAGHLTIKPTGQ